MALETKGKLQKNYVCSEKEEHYRSNFWKKGWDWEKTEKNWGYEAELVMTFVGYKKGIW